MDFPGKRSLAESEETDINPFQNEMERFMEGDLPAEKRTTFLPGSVLGQLTRGLFDEEEKIPGGPPAFLALPIVPSSEIEPSSPVVPVPAFQNPNPNLAEDIIEFMAQEEQQGPQPMAIDLVPRTQIVQYRDLANLSLARPMKYSEYANEGLSVKTRKRRRKQSKPKRTKKRKTVSKSKLSKKLKLK